MIDSLKSQFNDCSAARAGLVFLSLLDLDVMFAILFSLIDI